MHKLTLSTKIYLFLIFIFSLLLAISVFFPQGNLIPMQEMPASKPVMMLANFGIGLILYGLLGYLGLRLAKKLGFAELWDKQVTNKQRFLTPAIFGGGVGIFFILCDIIFSKFHALGPIPHPPFPTSILASATAGIGEEIIFRLFFISFWLWLISYVILRKRWQKQIFWIIAVLSALAFAAGHIPALLIIFGVNTTNALPSALLAEIILLNGVVSILAAHYFRKYGILAAMGIHFWADIVWHVIYGLF